MFLKSIDALGRVKDVNLLFELLDEMVRTVGEKNVGQIITYNASNYAHTGKMLESKYRTIFLNPMCCTMDRPHA